MGEFDLGMGFDPGLGFGGDSTLDLGGVLSADGLNTDFSGIGGGGGGSWWDGLFGGSAGNIGTASILGGLQYLAANQAQSGRGDELASQQAFAANQAALDRQAQMDLLKLRMAQESGAGSAAAQLQAQIARQRMMVDAYGNAATNRLSAAQLPIGAVARMVDAIQRGLGGIRG